MRPSALRDDARIDLRPPPWSTHFWIMGGLLALGFGFVIAAWPDANALEQAALILLSIFAGMTALFATALVSVFRRGRAPLLAAYATTLAVVALVIVVLAASP